LAAWVLLFFSGCFYTLGRCCISSRGPRNRDWDKDHERGPSGNNGYPDYTEQMRMDAVKVEADRKARQKEVGLPVFAETQPLTGRVDGENVYVESYQDHNPSPQPGFGRGPSTSGHAGYVQQPVGSRAIDDYYSPTRENYATPSNSYPPQPQPPRQASSHTYAPSNYAPSAYNTNVPQAPSNNQYLAPAFTHDRASTASYGHSAGGTTYHSAHEQYPSTYSQYQQPQADLYGANYYAAPTPTHHTANGYGSSSVPALPERSGSVPGLPEHPSTSGYVPYSTGPTSPPSHPMPMPGTSTSPGPQRTVSPEHYDDSPPQYDAGTGHVTGAWGKN
jgi:hypothetical protein